MLARRGHGNSSRSLIRHLGNRFAAYRGTARVNVSGDRKTS